MFHDPDFERLCANAVERGYGFALGSLEEIEVWLAAKCLFSLCHCVTDAKFPPQISKERPARSRRTPPPCNPHSTPHAGEAKATTLCRDTSFTQCKFVPSFFAYTGQRIANSSPHLFPICDASSSLTMGGELSAYGPRLHLFFWRRIMERLTLREALASDRLDAFVRQEEASGVELVMGSDLERVLALVGKSPA
jgi:hypothetical protein